MQYVLQIYGISRIKETAVDFQK